MVSYELTERAAFIRAVWLRPHLILRVRLVRARHQVETQLRYRRLRSGTTFAAVDQDVLVDRANLAVVWGAVALLPGDVGNEAGAPEDFVHQNAAVVGLGIVQMHPD